MAERTDFHEMLSRPTDTKSSSDRSFGLVFAVVFAAIAFWPLINGDGPRWWAVALATVFVTFALVRPILLSPLNREWTRFGRLLHTVMTPIIMGILFFLVVTPTALLMRLFGKIPLQLRFDSAARSYWIVRSPPGPAPDTMKRQF